MSVAPDAAIAHWSARIEGLQESPVDFYANVQTAVTNKMIPEATFERIEYREGGAFSGFRLYLRIRRYREVFDVCAAPFGTGCFFSWWLAEIRPTLPIPVSILTLFVYLMILGAFAYEFGILRGPIALLVLATLVLLLLSKMGKPEMDDFLMSLPLIGGVYERFFRPITYYRVDTSQMFQQAVQAAVMEVVDQVTTAKGMRPLSELERKPVMRDFFRK